MTPCQKHLGKAVACRSGTSIAAEDHSHLLPTKRTESSTQRYRSALQPIYRDTLLTELESATNLGI